MTFAPAILAFTALTMCWPLRATSHHSISVIDTSQPVWVKGTVVRYRPGSPHALLEVDATGKDGALQRWTLEGPFPGRMSRLIDLYGGNAEAYLKAGDRIELCGFRPRAQYLVERSYGDANIDRAHFIHAQLMLMPDGQMRTWGPYGKLDNCVRPGDKPQVWRDFLNRDALAHDLWCSGLRDARVPSVAPRNFVEEVNGGLATGCR